jgi:hypothetical protein
MKSITDLKKDQVQIFFGKLFQSRTIAHLAHLKTASYAKHKALQKYYEELPDFADKLIESYQGEHGIQSIKVPAAEYQDPVIHLKELLQTVKTSSALFSDSDYLNILDEIKSLIKQTLYKLQYLG